MATESSSAVWGDFSVTSIKGIAVLLPISGVILALWLKPVNVNFREFPKENVIGLLSGLVVISLFVERAVEVFLTPLRGTTCQKMTKDVKCKKARLDKENPDSVSQLKEAEYELLDFKGRTRSISFLISLALGMTVSASGVRGLASLLDARGCSAVFNGLDVLLTGALVAGGADGLHKIATVFTSFMEKSAENTKSA
jgi:hypothetical protein